MKVESYGASDTGKKRKNNEDSFLVLNATGLYAVADGIGGHEGGEAASRIAVETLAAAVPGLLGDGDRTPAAGRLRTADAADFALQQAFFLANSAIRSEQISDPRLLQMGTTLTALLLERGRAFIGHIGDSRAYLFRSGRVKQLTHDHSLVAENVRAGRLRPAEARTSPHRHIITRALGLAEGVEADFLWHAVSPGDTLLLCSDGLTEMVDDAMIATMLSGGPEECVRRLIRAANDRGGVDNITVVVIKVLSL